MRVHRARLVVVLHERIQLQIQGGVHPDAGADEFPEKVALRKSAAVSGTAQSRGECRRGLPTHPSREPVELPRVEVADSKGGRAAEPLRYGPRSAPRAQRPPQLPR